MHPTNNGRLPTYSSMRRKANYESGVFKYLQSLGILQESPEVIEHAKKKYWNARKLESKKAKAKAEKSFEVSFTQQELQEVAEASAMHNMSRSRFIKQACLAYLRKKYLVPNSDSLQNIKALLARNYSLLQGLYEGEQVPAEVAREMLLRMDLLERYVISELTQPKLMRNDR